MTDAIITTIISTGGAVIVGIAGMWISANETGKRIDDLRDQTGKRIDDLRSDVGKRLDEFGKRLDVIESDIKQFYALLAENDKRLSRLEDKLP